MKTLEEIKSQAHIYGIKKVTLPGATDLKETYGAALDLYDFKGTVIFGFDEEGWEHVSVSHANKRKLPTWEDMCRIKDLFWNKDEMAVQFHPGEKEYIHGVGPWKDSNVLHLWRPKDGDWGRITREEQEGTI